METNKRGLTNPVCHSTDTGLNVHVILKNNIQNLKVVRKDVIYLCPCDETTHHQVPQLYFLKEMHISSIEESLGAFLAPIISSVEVNSSPPTKQCEEVLASPS